jgi:hypothetical protein
MVKAAKHSAAEPTAPEAAENNSGIRGKETP